MKRTVQLEDPFGATEEFELQEETVAEAPPVPTPVRSTPAEAVLFSEDVDAWLSSAAEVKLTELEPYLKVALGWPSTQKKRDLLGEHPLFIIQICRWIQAGISSISIPTSEENGNAEIFQVLTLLFRLARNLCPNARDSQDKLREGGFLDQVVPFLSSVCDVENIASDSTPPSTAALRMGVQAVGNCVTANKNNQQYLWSIAFPAWFLHLLEPTTDKTVQSVVCMLLYNCIHGDPLRRRQLLDSRDLTDRLLQIVRQEDDSQDHSAFEWVYLLVTAFAKDECFSTLYHSYSPESSDLFVSRNQTLLLKLVDGMLHKHVQDNQETPLSCLPFRSCVALGEEFCRIYRQVTCHHIGEKEADELTKPVFVSNLEKETTYEALFLLLQILGMLSAANTDANDYELKSKLGADGVLSDMLSLLGIIHRWDELERAQPVRPEPSCEMEALIPNIKKDLVMVVANMCYRHRANQDLIGIGGYVPLILSQARLDDKNPLVREWAILAIRNFCEEHEDNQAIIAGLQPMGVAENRELSELGMEVVMNENGKFSLRKKSGQRHNQ